MRELNLKDDLINSTVRKINTICSNNIAKNYNKSNYKMAMAGNGDGNGSY